jgi:membrane protease YdiL (CAAX protease family)
VLWFYTLVIAVSACAASDLFVILNKWLPVPKSWAVFFTASENTYGNNVSAILDFKNFGTFLFSIALVALLPAVVEELFFRGALQPVLLKWTGKAFPAVLITSLLFSIIHLSFYYFLARLFFGVILGYVYHYGKNIRLTILIHFINNAAVITMFYITCGSKPLPQNMLADRTTVTSWIGELLCLFILIFGIKSFIKNSPKNI